MMHIGYCGLKCHECAVYIATKTNDTEAVQRLAREYSSDRQQFTPEDIRCEGCTHESSGSGKLCGICPMRNCAVEKGVSSCGRCAEYPCSIIEKCLPADSEYRAALNGIRDNDA